ncbi:hypothetical protein VOLCADRAFT_89588 [Volvox carteri f. nagariensis]|uniref:Uncharacterized protein n=1 Tax=Volvox carteri f. nagariensis TaxID=3068 RepID=D8TS85_VOLCA|nr:uncharacterized protein VOLCADRAFT_89588 [Volvox carteri f. nagariensis]EFJ49648.1 hypothetical protein VOLCADRAFT_89588 [Volvox carteri f. nagariensis]|eukprot:XP_002949155.1 hypothetical protein VOLCADRAFT_89588 [Volvox carteri f. nagariensis]
MAKPKLRKFALLIVSTVHMVTVLDLVNSSKASPPTQLLLDCFNGGPNGIEPLPPPADFHDFLDGVPVNLRLERVWWSRKQSQLPLTIFTMATLDRLPLLEAQCHSYPGPLSAALYMPLLLPPSPDSVARRGNGRRQAAAAGRHSGRSSSTTAYAQEVTAAQHRNGQLLAEALSKLQAAVSRLESSPAACSLVLALYTERLADPALAALMPTNALRNAALLPVRTPLAAMVDADLSVSRSLGQLAANSSRVSELLEGARDHRVLWVLPAWETRRGLDDHTAKVVVDSALADAAFSAEAAAGPLHPFDVYDFAGGHGPTDYERFFAADVPYPVPYSEGYEPWFVTARTLYRHEGGGPSQDIDYLSELMVRRFLPRTKFQHYVLRVRNLEYRERRILARHATAFKPQLGAAAARCRAVLPWWRRGHDQGEV